MSNQEIERRSGFRREAPVVIGGVGGSGTRVVAELLKEMGFYMGKLNKSNDNRTFASLFRHPEWFMRHHRSNPRVIYQALSQFEKQMLQHPDATSSRYVGWGWKNPVSHIYLDFLERYFSELRYIHVIRHGLDIAYSGNKNQLRLWGKLFQIKKPTPDQKSRAYLQYWIRSNQRAIQLGQKMGNRFYLLKYDDLCLHPVREISRLVRFLRLDPRRVSVQKLSKLVQRPPSIGRYKERGIRLFTPHELKAVQDLGFSVQGRRS